MKSMTLGYSVIMAAKASFDNRQPMDGLTEYLEYHFVESGRDKTATNGGMGLAERLLLYKQMGTVECTAT